MPLSFVATILISVALNIAAYLLTPRPKIGKPDSMREMDNPTADAGRPIPVIFGEVEIKEVNVLWYGDKTVVQKKR